MNWLIWLLFGNDDDGIYGEHSTEVGFGAPPLIQPKWWRAVRWWLRNPCHNAVFGPLRWPGGPFLNIQGILYIGFRPNKHHPKRDGVFGAALFRGYGE